MIAPRLVGAAALFVVALFAGSPAALAQAYVPGVTCPAGQAVTGDTPQTGIVCASLGTVFDNRLINPTMEIDQANEGSAVASSAGSLSAYVVDGVKVLLNSTATTKAVVSCQRVTDAPAGYAYSLKCTTTTAASAVNAGDYLVIAIPIEAGNIQDALLSTASAATLCRQ